MKKNRALFPLILSLTCCSFSIVLLVACQNNTLSDTLAFACSSKTNFQRLDSQVDTRNSFEISVPSSWKKEFFVDATISSFYCADTLKELQTTYLLDISHYNDKLPKLQQLQNKVKSAVFRKPEGKIVDEKELLFKEKETYYLYSTHTENQILTHTLELYMANKNNSFYRITLDIYGNSQVEKRICEALSLIDNCTFYY